MNKDSGLNNKIKLNIIRFLLLIFLFSIGILSAVNNQSSSIKNSKSSLRKIISFKRITIEDGLSQSTITCIIQDARGFMWFGTANGLNRYDGNKIHIYKNNPMNPFSLSSNRVSLCLLDNNGVLWFITGDHVLNRYDPDIDGFIQVQLFSKKKKLVLVLF